MDKFFLIVVLGIYFCVGVQDGVGIKYQVYFGGSLFYFFCLAIVNFVEIVVCWLLLVGYIS